MSTSVYGSVAYETRKRLLIIIDIILPFLIGLSRIYLGVHYPTDVFAGWFLGIISILTFSAIEQKFGFKIGLISILMVGCLGFFFCHDNDFYSAWGTVLGLLVGLSYEEKYVNFDMPSKGVSYLLRPLLGITIFLVFSTVLKIPAKLITGENLSHFYRLLRYTISTFVITGPYPLCFKKIGF